MNNYKANIIPYGRQTIEEDDIDAVVSVLKSDFLTTGPVLDSFERDIANYVGAKYAVGVSSGTAALDCALYAAGVQEGDEVIVTAITFVATVNAILYKGAIPIFCDVEVDTLGIDASILESKISSKTKAIISVDFAGAPVDYYAIKKIAKKNNLVFISDSCHSLGAKYNNLFVGALADLTVFSFHPVKSITTGEGGMVSTDNLEYRDKLRLYRNHGILNDFKERELHKTWFYEMIELGHNYRLTDIQAALGITQLKKLPFFLEKRNMIAKSYEMAFKDNSNIEILDNSKYGVSSNHLFVVQIEDRDNVFSIMRENNIMVNVHYMPVYLHPYYCKRYGNLKGLCPKAELAFNKILSLPIFPSLTDAELSFVIKTLEKCVVCK